jgi:general secretion pathway protein K
MEALRSTRRRGAALMLSLWALFLLSAMVISWALNINARVILSGYANRNIEALALACSGVEVAMTPNVSPATPVLEASFGKGQSYEARMTGEGGRIDLNWVVTNELANPGSPQRELLRKYLENKGIDLNERDQMIDTLLDWVDPDNLVRNAGAEDEGGYQPPNKGRLDRIEELKNIKGWEEFTSARDWDADFTLQTGNAGQNQAGLGIDIAWASKEVLMALPGASEDRVDQFVEMRSGPDGIVGTEDDAFRQNQNTAGVAGGGGGFDQDQALAVLGYSSPQQLTGLILAVEGNVWRAVSVGRSGDVSRVVRVVFRKQGNNVQLKSWKEF